MWCIQQPADFLKIFPKGCFGSYQTDDLNVSKVFSLACSKEAFLVVNLLKNIQASMNQSFPYAQLCAERTNQLDFEDSLNDLDTYHGVYRIFARELRDATVERRDHSFIHNKFGDSFLFDCLVHIIMSHVVKSPEFRLALTDPATRKAVFRSTVEQVLERSVEEFASFQHPSVWIGDLDHLAFTFNRVVVQDGKCVPTAEPASYRIDMKQHLDYLGNLPQPLKCFGMKHVVGINSNLMIYGDKGTGKSGVLNYVATWAWKNNWLLLKIPSVHRITQEEIRFVRHEESRVYLQNELAKEVLDDFVATNAHLLQRFPFNPELYGQVGLAGNHLKEPEPVPNSFDEWTQSRMHDSDKFLMEGEQAAYLNVQREWKISLKERLPSPKSLLELIAFAEKHPLYTTAILAEVIEQLQNQEAFPVLSLADDFNYFFRRTVYPSFRYDNKALRGTIPAYHLSVCRLFLKMDGHKFKNGFKLVASSHTHLYKHVFSPDKINYPAGFGFQVTGMKLNDFRNSIYHYVNTNIMKQPVVGEQLIQQYYVESQGNWKILFDYFRDRTSCFETSRYKLDKAKLRGMNIR